VSIAAASAASALLAIVALCFWRRRRYLQGKEAAWHTPNGRVAVRHRTAAAPTEDVAKDIAVVSALAIDTARGINPPSFATVVRGSGSAPRPKSATDVARPMAVLAVHGRRSV